MSSVCFEEIEKIYPPDVLAVESFNLTIEDGEFLVLLGPSGCGKSTVLNMIAGLEAVTAGTIHIGDRDVTGVAPKDRDIAMVFQNYALYPHMNVFDNMAFGLRMRKVGKDDINARVRSAADRLGIADLLERKPAALSGGQRQRVALGRAIVREPAVFLFDEPLSNLDAKMRVAMRAEIKTLHRDLGQTMIYVTHDQIEAMTMGDRIVIMKDGRIQQVGAPLDVYDHPANRFVAGFIGTPPVNFIEGTLEGRRFRAEGVDLTLPTDLVARVDAKVITLGIRPEDLLLEAPSNEVPSLTAKVSLTEPLGGDMIVHLDVAGHSVLAKLDAHAKVEPGKLLTLFMRPDRIHLFEQSDASANLTLQAE